MRITFLILSIFILQSCGENKEESKKETKPEEEVETVVEKPSEKPLDGTWKPEYQEMGGQELPKEILDKQSLTISDNIYVLTAESTDAGIISIHDGKMDIYGEEGPNKGKHFMAIYKLEDDKLTICYNLAGDSYPENFETKDKPMFFLSRFVKE